MNRYLLLFFLSFCSIGVFGQKVKLTGTVTDQSGQVIPGAGVYIANSKMAVSTDPAGKFTFLLDPGKYDVLFQMIGFLPASKNVSLESGPVQVTMVLKESETKIGEVVIKPDKDREYHLGLFRDFFVGKTPNSAKTKILNTQVLRTDYDPASRKLKVSSDEFLELENEALGYKIKYLLNIFEYDLKSGIVYYEGYPTFEEMGGGTSKQNKWERMRLIAYNGSLQHFFSSLAANTATQDGFVIHKVVPMKESEKSNLASPRGVFRSASEVTIRSGEGKKAPGLMLRRDNILIDTLVHKEPNGTFSLNFKDELYVIYNKEREEGNYQYSGFWQSRPLDIPNFQISKITPLKLPMRFYKNGGVADPSQTLYSGYFAYEKVGDQLPIEYQPPGVVK